MKILFLSIVAALAVSSASADILVYKQKIALTISGDGGVKSKSVGGYLILDASTLELVQIVTQTTITKRKLFHVQVVDDHSVSQLNLGALKSATLITQTTRYDDDNDRERTDSVTIKGANAKAVNIGAESLWNVPKSMTLVSRSTYPALSPAPLDADLLLEEGKGALALDLKTSVILNTAHNDIEEATAYLRQSLLNLGYEEFD